LGENFTYNERCRPGIKGPSRKAEEHDDVSRNND